MRRALFPAFLLLATRVLSTNAGAPENDRASAPKGLIVFVRIACLVLVASLVSIVAFDASSRSATQPRAVAAPTGTHDVRTYIHPRGKAGRFYVACGQDEVFGMLCYAAWADPDLGVWAFRLNRSTWVAGSESIRSDHYDAYAYRRTARLWRVAYLGTVRFHSPGRWDIYKGKKFIGYASGPQGAPAGLLWLYWPA